MRTIPYRVYKHAVGANKDSSEVTQTVECRVKLTDREFRVLMNNDKNCTMKEKSKILRDTTNQAQKYYLTKYELTCFNCTNKAVRSINTPTFMPNRNDPYIIDVAFQPICHKSTCGEEGKRFTKAVMTHFKKKTTNKDEDEQRNLFLECEILSCAYCCKTEENKDLRLLTCGICKAVHYCNRDCQKKHWKEGHKQVCRPAKVQRKIDAKAISLYRMKHGDRYFYLRDESTMKVVAKKIVDGQLARLEDGSLLTMEMFESYDAAAKKRTLIDLFSQEWDFYPQSKKKEEVRLMPQICHSCGRAQDNMSPDPNVGYTRLLCSDCCLHNMMEDMVIPPSMYHMPIFDIIDTLERRGMNRPG